LLKSNEAPATTLNIKMKGFLLSSTVLATISFVAKGEAVCDTIANSNVFSCGSIPDGTPFGDLQAWRAAVKDEQKCGCLKLYEDAGNITGYNAAYNVACAGRLAGPKAKGYKGFTDLYKKDSKGTLEKCRARCEKTPGCGGFSFKFAGGANSCRMTGENPFCDGNVTKKGAENADPPVGPGKDKGLLTSRWGQAFYYRTKGAVPLPKSWNITEMGGPAVLNQRIKDIAIGKTTAEAFNTKPPTTKPPTFKSSDWSGASRTAHSAVACAATALVAFAFAVVM